MAQARPTVPELDQKSIIDASTPDIRLFAKEVAGLDFDEHAGREHMINEVFEALEWDAYRPEDEATHVVVELPITERNKHPYQGGFRGEMFTIKRGEPVTISIEQYNTMIDSAKMAFGLKPLDPNSPEMPDGAKQVRVPRGAIDMTVHKFLKKGAKRVLEPIGPIPPGRKVAEPQSA